MSNVPREKIALVVFVGLIAVSLCGLFGYLTLGHSWNVAASNIDDAAGRMDGYTAIVYEGTVAPESADRKKAAKEPGAGQGEATRAPGFDAPDRAAGGAEAASPESKDPADAAGAERDAAENGPVADSGSRDREDAGVTGKDPAAGPSAGESAHPTPSDEGLLEEETPVDIDEVEQSYLDKNATVFVIDSGDLELYREGTILKKGSHRFGIFSTSLKTTAKTVAAHVEYFQSHDVDFIVALTPDKKIVEDVLGIDIVISTKDEGLFVMGETIGTTFYVNAPQIGSAGVILISPSNVVSAKVIQGS